MYVLLSLRPLRRPEIGVHRGQTERRFGVQQGCRAGRHYAWLPVGPTSQPVPVGAPLRESSPDGACGTPPGSDHL
jgi:hypothetical protein